MSITAVSSQTSPAPTTSTDSKIKDDCIINPKNFIFLIPTITALALGIIFLPNFGLGLAAGAGMLVVTIIAMRLLTMAGVIEDKTENNSEYARLIQKSLLDVAVFGPIAEEAIFRGGMQPMLTRAIIMIVPAAAATMVGIPFSIATTVSILATGIIFGAIHYLNPHKAAFQQAVSASIGGIAYGILSAQFGFGAAVAAHIANNTIISTLLGFKPSSRGVNIEEPRPQIKVTYSPLPA